MALLFIDSFDHYNTAHALAKWTSSTLSAPPILVGKGRCGTNCMQISGSLTEVIKGLPFGSTTGTVGFAVYYPSAGTLAFLTQHTVSFGDSATNHLQVFRLPDGSLEVLGVGPGSGDIFLGQTAPGLVQMDHWYFVELQATIHPTAGVFTLRLNNVVVLTMSGLNTVGSGAAPTLRRVEFKSSSNQSHNIDDLYILDSTGPAPQNTFLGDCRVEYLRPRAAGVSQAWTLNGTASTHWQAVDDNATPDDDGSYIEANAPGLTDMAKYQPTGLPAGPIFGAQLNLHARKSDAGPRVISPVVNGAPSAVQYAPSYDAYQYYSTLYPTNPATGLPWTIAEINAAEFGVTVVT